MRVRVQLGEADRQRFGAPEWLTFDASVLMTDEAEVFEESFGIFAEEWFELLDGVTADGTKIRRPVKVMRAVIWLALTRAGLEVDPPAVKFDLLGVRTQPDPEVGEGKGGSPSTPPAASAGSRPATASRSRRPSASGRGKSTS